MANRHNITFNTEAEYNTFKASSGYVEPNVSYVTESNVVHYNPFVDPYAGHDYVEIGGLKWATMNIGASQPSDYGLYFQWGDTQGYTASQVGSGEGQKYFDENDCIYYNDGSYTKYNETDGKTILEASDDAVTAAWGGQWRMPTTEEYVALGNAVNTAWTADYQGSGVAGLVCTDKNDTSNVLFFPAAGNCSNGNVSNVGGYGIYWSSFVNSSFVQAAHSLYLDSSYLDWQSGSYRYNGFPVRGVVG